MGWPGHSWRTVMVRLYMARHVQDGRGSASGGVHCLHDVHLHVERVSNCWRAALWCLLAPPTESIPIRRAGETLDESVARSSVGFRYDKGNGRTECGAFLCREGNQLLESSPVMLGATMLTLRRRCGCADTAAMWLCRHGCAVAHSWRAGHRVDAHSATPSQRLPLRERAAASTLILSERRDRVNIFHL